MNELERLELVKALINDTSVSDDTISSYLSLAKGKILGRLYPFGNGEEEIPKKYHHLWCELASRYIFRRGVEGQRGSTDNGVTRSYDSVNDEDLLSEVVQVIGMC